MKKSHPFNKMSELKCKCGKLLKERMVEQKQTKPDCYKCHLAEQAGRNGKSVTFMAKAKRELG